MHQSENIKIKLITIINKDEYSFIPASSRSSSPPLEKDGLVFVEEEEKANVLNDFFRGQTLLNDHDAVLPEIAPYRVERCLFSRFFIR